MIKRISLLILTVFLISSVSATAEIVTKKPNMDVVDFETQYHIERLCRTSERDGVVPFWNCLRKELKIIGIVQ